jgi:hypothetical protein
MSEKARKKQLEYTDRLMSHYWEEYRKAIALIDAATEVANTTAHYDECMSAITENLAQSPHYIVDSFEYPLSTHRKGLSGKADIFIKRVIRKVSRFLLAPYAERLYHFQVKSIETNRRIAELLEVLANERIANGKKFLDIKLEIKQIIERTEELEEN